LIGEILVVIRVLALNFFQVYVEVFCILNNEIWNNFVGIIHLTLKKTLQKIKLLELWLVQSLVEVSLKDRLYIFLFSAYFP